MNWVKGNQSPALLGILVGGHSTRMGGQPKGLLRTASGKTIVESLALEFLAARPSGKVLLLGRHEAYGHLGFPQRIDSGGAEGPMGGAHTLLREAQRRGATALLVGCDMPHVERGLFQHLLTARPEASALAPRKDGRWEPLLSRYSPGRPLTCLLECVQERRYSFQYWLSLMNCTELPLSDNQQTQLRDWDTPEDIGS